MVQPKRFLREPLEGELVPSLQEGELVPSLQEDEETLSLQEGEDVLVPEGFDHFSAWLSLGVNQESSYCIVNVNCIIIQLIPLIRNQYCP